MLTSKYFVTAPRPPLTLQARLLASQATASLYRLGLHRSLHKQNRTALPVKIRFLFGLPLPSRITQSPTSVQVLQGRVGRGLCLCFFVRCLVFVIGCSKGANLADNIASTNRNTRTSLAAGRLISPPVLGDGLRRFC